MTTVTYSGDVHASKFLRGHELDVDESSYDTIRKITGRDDEIIPLEKVQEVAVAFDVEVEIEPASDSVMENPNGSTPEPQVAEGDPVEEQESALADASASVEEPEPATEPALEESEPTTEPALEESEPTETDDDDVSQPADVPFEELSTDQQLEVVNAMRDSLHSEPPVGWEPLVMKPVEGDMVMVEAHVEGLEWVVPIEQAMRMRANKDVMPGQKWPKVTPTKAWVNDLLQKVLMLEYFTCDRCLQPLELDNKTVRKSLIAWLYKPNLSLPKSRAEKSGTGKRIAFVPATHIECPEVAKKMAVLWGQYPDAGEDFAKALIASASEITDELRPHHPEVTESKVAKRLLAMYKSIKED